MSTIQTTIRRKRQEIKHWRPALAKVQRELVACDKRLRKMYDNIEIERRDRKAFVWEVNEAHRKIAVLKFSIDRLKQKGSK